MTAVLSLTVCQMSALGAHINDGDEKKSSRFIRWVTGKNVTLPSSLDVTSMVLTLTPGAAARLQHNTFIIYPDYPEGDNRTVFCQVFSPEDRRKECLVKWHFPKDQKQINVRFPWSDATALRGFKLSLPAGHPSSRQHMEIAIGISKDGSLTWMPSWEA